MPYIVLEALAARKPVIASRVGGIPEILGKRQRSSCRTRQTRSHLPRSWLAAIVEKDWSARVMPDPKTFKSRFAASVMTAEVLRLYRDLCRDQSAADKASGCNVSVS